MNFHCNGKGNIKQPAPEDIQISRQISNGGREQREHRDGPAGNRLAKPIVESYNVVDFITWNIGYFRTKEEEGTS